MAKKTKGKRVKRGSPPLPSRRGMERKIVVRMSPLSIRDVKIRAKSVRRAKPRVVFDPVTGD